MPLSEDEQRILRQIEEQLQRDPSFGREIRHRAPGSRRAMIVTIGATLVCLAASVLLLPVSPYLAFVAFVGAVFAVSMAERHVRALGEHSITNLGSSVRNRFGGPSSPRPSN